MDASIGSVFHTVFFLLLAGVGVLLIMLAVAITSSRLDGVMEAVLGVTIGVIGVSMFCFGVQMVFPLN
jgi:hypothetical protein